MSDENINADEPDFDASKLSEGRKAELDDLSAQILNEKQPESVLSQDEDISDILHDIKNRDDLSESSQSALNKGTEETPPEWINETIPLPTEEDIPEFLQNDEEVDLNETMLGEDKSELDASGSNVQDNIKNILADEEIISEDELQPFGAEDEGAEEIIVKGDAVPDAELDGVKEIESVFEEPELDQSFEEEPLPSDFIQIDEESMVEDFDFSDGEINETESFKEEVLEDHAAENDFDIKVDADGKDIPEIANDSMMDEAALKGKATGINNEFPKQPIHPPAQQSAGQVAMRPPLFGSLGSLFNRNKNADNTSQINFTEHLERAASKDIEKLLGMQSEHTNLLKDVIKATSPANYNPDNEGNVLNMIKSLEQSARVIETQSDRLSVTTSNMKDQNKALDSNNQLFTKQVEQMNELLAENSKDIDSSAIKEALSNFFSNIKKFINQALGRTSDKEMEVS